MCIAQSSNTLISIAYTNSQFINTIFQYEEYPSRKETQIVKETNARACEDFEYQMHIHLVSFVKGQSKHKKLTILLTSICYCYHH